MPSDFSDVTDIAGTFTGDTEGTTIDFVETGDQGQITIEGSGYGEGGYGEGGYGGTDSVIVNSPTTVWTDIETP